METIIAFFMIPWVFITCLSILTIVGFVLVDYEQFGWNTVFVLAILGLLQVNYHIFEDLKDNPLNYILSVITYFMVGVIWSFGKWYSILSTHARKIKKIKEEMGTEWNNPERLKEIIEKIPGAWGYSSSKTIQIAIEKSFPKLSENKGNITGWIIYWPFSLVATIFNDPVKRFANYIFETLSSIYEEIKNHVIKTI